MSFDAHEAFCFDSFAQSLIFWDDFEGDALKDLWTVTVVVGGTAVVVDAQTGGIVRLSAPTNVTGDTVVLSWGDIRSLLVSKKVTIEWRLKLSSVSDFSLNTGIWFNSLNRVEFVANSSDLNIRCENNNIQTLAASGITLDTDYHIYRIECFPTGEVHFYYDDVETANSPITTNITAEYLQPYFWMVTAEAAEKQMDIDYVYIRQERG